MNTVTITKAEAVNLIKTSNGKMFTVMNIKKDGTERTYNGRLGVKKYLKGGESTTKHIPSLITVFDNKANEGAGGYRCININTIKYFACNGTKFIVE